MRLLTVLLSGLLLLGACKVNKNKSTANENGNLKPAPSARKKSEKIYPYQASVPHINDLQHTWLNLRFDYTKQYVLGEAVLTLKPHFYATDSLLLDARQFLLHRIARIEGRDTLPLKYTYDDAVVRIALGRSFTHNENYKIYINYTARPNEVKQQGSAAISEAKGLYFINPLRTDTTKPRQIWSQGETQANSCWFPTIDAPNQKMTQEILLTVDKKNVTLSNGELMLSKENKDGTRTDQWKQNLPHAPYLAMIAVGEFAIIKDYWRDEMEVNYYVEPAFKPYAKLVFGNTPEMLECFSTKLGVNYPWEKFSQIVVRDFVSGAMENTSAVVHFEPLQHNAREHMDNTFESIIAHELFHQWFGDYVTCESWSNLPLNESFATYGEYIWNEHKYGRAYADMELETYLHAYLDGNRNIDKTPIRFHYKTQEDMFDAVSYQKGGHVLHMLRKLVGDSAFFQSLQYYLTQNKFGTVEIHNLRLAFEHVTGLDLNWFFNQWFLKPGNPHVTFDYVTTSDGKEVAVLVKQQQDSARYGLYRLPIAVDVYDKTGHVTRQQITISKKAETFTFSSSSPIELVNMDAEKILLAKTSHNQSKAALTYQFLNAPLYADKWEALKAYTGDSTMACDSNLLVMAGYALKHPFFGIRKMGIEILGGASATQLKPFEFTLRSLIKNDSAATVRASGIDLLKGIDPGAFEPLFEEKINDSSYQVASSALIALHAADARKGLQQAKLFERETNGTMLGAVSHIYSKSNDTTLYTFFIPAIKRADHYSYNLLQDYWEYTMMQLPRMQVKCLNELLLLHRDPEAEIYTRYINVQLAQQMQKQNNELADQLKAALAKTKKDETQKQNIETALADLNMVDELLNKFTIK